MTQAELIRKLQTLTVNTNYKALLANEFGVQVPDSAPKYQQEYLYKYMLELNTKSTPEETKLVLATAKVNELMERFPWCKTKYETVVEAAKPTRKVKGSASVTDGTIVFNEKYKMFEGVVNGKVVSRCKTEEKVKLALIKYDIKV